jgi:hypothetical protein
MALIKNITGEDHFFDFLFLFFQLNFLTYVLQDRDDDDNIPKQKKQRSVDSEGNPDNALGGEGEGEEEDDDENMMAALGFSGFNSTKVRKVWIDTRHFN